jgi:hypothetical protein
MPTEEDSMKLKHIIAALVGGAFTGGVALDVLGFPAAVASGAAAGVTAANALQARRFWN